jgi:hypothetical protein
MAAPFSTTLVARVLAGSLFVALVITALPALAQNSYTPQRPVLSPWLQLGQSNSGPLDNYHTYVQPQLQLYDTLRQQSTEIERQKIGLQNLSYEVSSPLGKQAAMVPTGQGGTFMNLGHYYGSNRTSISRTPAAAATRQAISRSVAVPGVPSF